MFNKIPWGIRNDKLIHISEISSENKGLKCNCVCPSCGTKLEAHKGIKNIEYFKHKNDESSCNTALETATHIFAKYIIEKEKRFNLPAVSKGDEIIFKERELVVDNVKLENRIGEIVPDIICKINNKELIIEINVTHPVSEKKKDKIELLGIAAIEISISQDIIFSKPEVIANHIINEVKNKKWIFNKNTINYEKEIKIRKEYIIQKSNLLQWRERGGKEVKQVSCKNPDYFEILINGFKADIYTHCKKCNYYQGHNSNGVLCSFGVIFE